MYGPQMSITDPNKWDGVLLKKSLGKDHPLLELMAREQKSENKWATERGVYWRTDFFVFKV